MLDLIYVVSTGLKTNTQQTTKQHLMASDEIDTKVPETGKRIKTYLDLIDADSLSLGLIVLAD